MRVNVNRGCPMFVPVICSGRLVSITLPIALTFSALTPALSRPTGEGERAHAHG
jgi:hypothetical protein